MRRKLKLAGITLFIGLSLVFGYLIYLQIKHPPVPPPTVSRSGGSSNGCIAVREAPPLHDEGSQDSSAPESRGGLPAGPDVENVLGEDVLKVLAVDSDEKPVVGVSINAVASDRHGERQYKQHFLGDRVTNSSGVAEFGCKAGWTIELKLVSDMWFAARLQVTITSRDQTALLRLVPSATITFKAQFDDLAPFSGMYSLRAPAMSESGLSTDSVFHTSGRAVGSEKTTIRGVPSDQTFTLLLFSERAGYDDCYVRIEPSDVLQKRYFEVTIPRSSSPKGIITLDVSDFFDSDTLTDMKVLARIRNVDSGLWMYGISFQAKDYVKSTGQMPPGEYAVIVVGGGKVWSSGKLILHGGETLKITANPEQAARALVTVIDSSGTPIRGAVLKYWDGVFPSWPTSPMEGSCSVTGPDGVAELASLPAGEVDLLVDGNGYEGQHFTVVLYGGAIVDIGRVVLQPANGTVVVRFSNPKEGLRYRIGYLNRGAGPSSMTEIGDDQISKGMKLEHLPLRELIIIVSPIGGGKGAHVIAALSGQQTTVDIEIDLANAIPQNH